ncbi:sigma-70 family RNA polymerase sigma factor [Brevibacillus laterosporus]|uniref:RNA polymerase n=2 Tax=Brevibacillus TaxID=55080 RepID=A0A0F7EFY6_BRELA|nr:MULTISPECIES: sigma-70 family RNA polymerase sigma factor [Brevibacillus]AKF93387.1 RNA polymerase [Brevibacillus laterosporus]MCR8985758.1 sigma-70 family RNA polymerase sigma factor [Brevibacillus laterosporus]MCZ0831492.1 sigma-70 family RNA polymerase sigma factor [Brevibacillus halotolerans]MDN9012595.1 sigma-70 family RNA polymerase sigma factor [Brevibacillus laterosporus]MDO0943646.1 sigma-70 family RNA polymerase sigma factor [Brevibacillus laterosporus]
MQDDKKIIEQVLQGNKEAYAELIDRYQTKVFFILKKMLGHSQNQQDIIQEIFIKAYYHLSEYRSNYDFSAWLYRIAVNHCLDELRKQKRTPSVVQTEIMLVDRHTPEDEYLEKEQRLFVRQRMLTLEEKYRKVLDMRYFQYLSYEEISKKLSVPISTIRMRLSRGKMKLRESIEKIGKRGDSRQ